MQTRYAIAGSLILFTVLGVAVLGDAPVERVEVSKATQLPEFPKANIWTRATPSVAWCGDPTSTVTVEAHIVGRTDVSAVSLKDSGTVGPPGPPIALRDDGLGGDHRAGDGIFTASGFQPRCQTPYLHYDHSAGTWWGELLITLTDGRQFRSAYGPAIGMVTPQLKGAFPVETYGGGLTASQYAFFIEDPLHKVFNGYPIDASWTPQGWYQQAKQNALGKFATVFPDNFDMAVVTPGLQLWRPDSYLEHSPYMQPLNNGVKGIGRATSSAGRLASVIYESFGDTGVVPHEIGHTWGAYIAFSLGLQGAGAHWKDLTDINGQLSLPYVNQAGQYGYFSYNGDGTWRWVPSSESARRFAPLELYLMGLVPAEEVPPIHILTTPNFSDPNRITAASVRTVTVQDIIAAEGSTRLPAVASAPKEFNVAFIVVQDKPFNDAAYAYFSVVGQSLMTRNGPRQHAFFGPFYWATGGRASLNTRLFGDACSYTVSPANVTMIRAGGTGTQTVTAPAGCAWTAGSGTSWITITAGANGTANGSVSYSVEANGSNVSRRGTLIVAGQTIAVSQTGNPTLPPFGVFDTPVTNTTVQGSIAVAGWALDDVGVERVEIWRNCLTPIDSTRPGVCRTATPTGAADKVFIGNAAFVPGARTDIENNAEYSGYPQAYRAGWGYMLATNALPNQTSGAAEGGQGPVTLYAYAIDREGRYTELGSKTVTLDNDNSTVPFGAIDTPEQGGTVTAAVSANFGWAMTRRRNAAGVNIPKCIERTRYRVFVDGVARTLTTGVNWHPNLVRADLTAAYPGLCDSANSLAAYYLDVTALGLTNGTHTIGWDVYDDNGTPGNTADDNVAGIGSRFFNILVGAADAPVEDRLRDRPARRGAASDLTALPATESRELRARVGAVEAPVVAVDGDPAGRRAVNLPQGSRLAVDLGGAVTRGYLVVGDELRDLPIGSTLDAATGHFYWEPAVPFFGSFELVFVSDAQGSAARTTVVVTVTDPTASGDPAITITSPNAGANPNPVIAVTGTARDPQAVSGSGIDTVHVWAYRSDVAGVPPQFLGEASLKGEVYALTTAPLSPGTYDVAVFAWVTRTGTWAPAAVVNIAVR
jgi:hypothetical protein